MKSKSPVKLLLLGCALIILATGCGYLGLVMYGQAIKPRETWYFSRGFDKQLDPSAIHTTIADSCNISRQAIRLARMDDYKMVCYWVDVDTSYFNNRDYNSIRFKIVDSNGVVIRYLDGFLVPETSTKIDYRQVILKTDKKGNLLVSYNGVDYRIHHAGDMMGLHHFDITIPPNIDPRATLQYNWDGYGYNYRWISVSGKRDDFWLLNEYSYEGELKDSIYVIPGTSHFTPANNYFIKWDDWNLTDNYIINQGVKVGLTWVQEPFGGYGADVRSDFINPVMHSFNPGSYFKKCLGFVHFGQRIEAFNFLRNEQTLRIVNETVKSIGYDKFVPKSEFTRKQYGIRGSYFVNYDRGYSLYDINDSLIYYYHKDVAPAYYQEFWDRRASEQNAEYVYAILLDLKKYYTNESAKIDSTGINIHLKTLLTFDLNIQNEKGESRMETIMDLYSYLTENGMKQSAYNLLFTDSISQGIPWKEKEEIYRELSIDKKAYTIHGKNYFLTRNRPSWIE